MIAGPPISEHLPAASPSERPAIAVFIAFWLVWIGAIGWLRFTHPGIQHGDPTTDSNILNAGENWDRDPGSMWRSAGVPAIDTFRGDGKTPDWYTTYPPGAYWFHQALKAVGPGSPGFFRVVSISVSAAAVLLLLALVKRVCGSARPAVAASILYMTARPFVELGDNLHYISLSQLTLLAALYAWTRFEAAQSAAGSGAWFAACAAALLVDSLLTFEHALFILAFGAIRCLWTRRGGRLAGVALLGAVPAVVLGVRLIMNRAVLGSFGAAIAVMRAKAEQRMGSGAAGTGFASLISVWHNRLVWPGANGGGPLDGPDAEFAIPILSWWIGAPLVALASILVATWHIDAMKPVRRGVGLGALMLGGGLTWFALMTEHAIDHRFDAMLILPGIAVLAGSLVAGGQCQRLFQSAGAPVRFFGRGLAVLVLGAWLVSLKSSYALNTVMRADSTVRDAVHRRREAASAFAAAGRELGERAGVKRVWMFDRDAPAGRALGLPFDNLSNGLRASLAADEAQLVPMWWPESRQAAARGAAELGLPDVLSPGIGEYVVLRSARSEADRVEIETVSGLRIDRMAWRPTLNGAGWVFICLVSGDLDHLRGLGVTLRLVGTRGETEELIADMAIPAAGGTLDGDLALMWAATPLARLEGLAGVSLRALVPGRPGQSGWNLEFGRAGAGWRRGERSITWSPPPWTARQPPPPPLSPRDLAPPKVER